MAPLSVAKCTVKPALVKVAYGIAVSAGGKCGKYVFSKVGWKRDRSSCF